MSRELERKLRFEISGGSSTMDKNAIADGQLVLFRIPIAVDVNELNKIEFTDKVMNEILENGGSTNVALENTPMRLSRSATADQILLLSQDPSSKKNNVQILHHGLFPVMELSTAETCKTTNTSNLLASNNGTSPVNLFRRVPVKTRDDEMLSIRPFQPTGYGCDAKVDKLERKERKRKNRSSDDKDQRENGSKPKKASKKK